jgi:hypothetical protein
MRSRMRDMHKDLGWAAHVEYLAARSEARYLKPLQSAVYYFINCHCSRHF